MHMNAAKPTLRAPSECRRLAFSLALLGATAAMAAGVPGHPPPGEYLIDSDTTILGIGPEGRTGKTEQHVDGATGRTTVIRTVPGEEPLTQVYAGERPYSMCLSATAVLPPPGAGMGCSTEAYSTSAVRSSMSANCGAVKVNYQWRRIDDRTWERVSHNTMSTKAMMGITPASQKGMMEMAMAGMSPAERERGRAELAKLPTDRDVAAAMAPVVADLEKQARSGSPSEAAMAKEQLAAIKGHGGGAPDIVTDVRERWTRVSDTCKPVKR
jgi:hypothetical protein